MPQNRLNVLLGWIALVGGCDSTDPHICAVPAAALTISVRNGTGQALGGLTVTDTVRRSGAVLNIVSAAMPDTLPVAGLDYLTVATNEMDPPFRPTGDDVAVVVAADGHVGTGVYRLDSMRIDHEMAEPNT